ncbi:cysteine desulfurase-like protein [Sphingomonas sp.]|uniref:cysteine desulfurase-like protein n=1 Tax=Sphingomonas sp. TaxID=28214 RepID=UPI0025CF18A4|nr:cysteine desulfurase-like protein [Sphingomonas sp.]
MALSAILVNPAKSFPIETVRAAFPSLQACDGGLARIYLDGPGGTQVCAPAIAAITRHFEAGTANSGGSFATSQNSDATTAAARAAMADLLGGGPDEIAFGPNMTSLTIAVARALARDWQPGDELVVTRLDHDANVAPWLAVAADRNMTVRWLDFDPRDGQLDIGSLPSLINAQTRLVAVGHASNAIGTLHDIGKIVKIVRQFSNALVFVDAVQSVPHVTVDVMAMGCDLLVCSPYKFFGPHQGVLWGHRELLERIRPYKLRPSPDYPAARRFETGTPSFEGQAGTAGAIEYLETLGGGICPVANDRRGRLAETMAACISYEEQLGHRLLEGLATLPAIKLWGPPTMAGRVPTFGMTIAGHDPHAVATALATRNIYAWAGSFYAAEAVERLGLTDRGGLLRLGLCHYNTIGEVDRTVEALAEII